MANATKNINRDETEQDSVKKRQARRVNKMQPVLNLAKNSSFLLQLQVWCWTVPKQIKIRFVNLVQSFDASAGNFLESFQCPKI